MDNEKMNMDNENLNNEEIETNEPVVEETTAEVSDETTETVETEETQSVETETDEATDEETEVIPEETVEGEIPAEVVEIDGDNVKHGISGGKIAAIAGGAVAVALILIACLFYYGVINLSETGYIDVSGVTLEELADESGYSLKEYKEMNDLPRFMPKSTNENAVKNNITLRATIAQSGMKFEDFKDFYGWGDNITEDSTVGEALGETKLSVMLGLGTADEETANKQFASFKKAYGLGDDVTLDTLYKDVRDVLDAKSREERIAQEKEEADKAKKSEEKSEDKDKDKDKDKSDKKDADAGEKSEDKADKDKSDAE